MLVCTGQHPFPDTFWDFVSLMPEATHTIMWVLSPRGVPRSYRMMEGFGVHSFKWINAEGKASFVKYHWKPKLGTHSVMWDEAQKISGLDPDFHRRDLWEAIDSGNYPEWELGVQIVAEEDEHKFDFDLLDPTKIIPEALVPVKIIGKMTLNRNPDNFFAETEQVAFHPGHVVPGGVINPDKLRTHESALKFLKEFFDQKKPVGAICHGPQILIDANLVKGREMTSVKNIRQDLINAGANWHDEEVVVDQGLVTSRTPKDLPAFNEKLVEEIKEGKHKDPVPDDPSFKV